MKSKYRIVVEGDIELLEQEVRRYLELGWACAGGLAIIPETRTNIIKYCQAMTLVTQI